MFLGHWQFFKDFFQIGFLRYLLFWFAIVPIFLTLFWGLPPELPLFGTAHIVHFALPFSWWMLWLASLFYLLAYILFHVFCPQFIKRYPSYTEYLTHGHSARWIAWEFYYAVYGPPKATNIFACIWKRIFFFFSPIRHSGKLFDRVIKKKYAQVADQPSAENPAVGENETVTYFEHKGVHYAIAAQPDQPGVEIKVREIFWEILEHFAEQAPFLRGLITALVGITAALLICVLLQHVWTVFVIVTHARA